MLNGFHNSQQSNIVGYQVLILNSHVCVIVYHIFVNLAHVFNMLSEHNKEEDILLWTDFFFFPLHLLIMYRWQDLQRYSEVEIQN